MSYRPAAVAGSFYPSNIQPLQEALQSLLAKAANSPLLPQVQGKLKAIIVPHAGYIYSGSIAATAYHLLQQRRDNTKRVLLLGPNHRVALRGMAIPSHEAFTTPLGNVPLDQKILTALSRMQGVKIMDQAHALEHSLEVQLPFLQTVLDSFSLIPVVVGECSPDLVQTVLQLVWDDPKTLIVVSTDLSHFHDYHSASDIDRQTSELICQKDWHLHGEQACGANPLNGLLKYAVSIGADIVELARCNSGDTAGDRDRVVGYGAYALFA